MPTYDLRNKETGEVETRICSIATKEELVESGEWEQVFLSTPSIVSHTGNIVNKTSGDWKDHLKRIKTKSGGNSGLSKEQKRKYGFVDNSINT